MELRRLASRPLRDAARALPTAGVSAPSMVPQTALPKMTCRTAPAHAGSGMAIAQVPSAMNQCGRTNTGRNVGAEPRGGLRVDDAEAMPVHFTPLVKEWIAYLAERLARELIRESKRPAK